MDKVNPKECPETIRHENTMVFGFEQLSPLGVLWIINRVIFHPRGYALAIVFDDDKKEPIGWRIQGRGGGVWSFDIDENEKFDAFEALLAQAKEFDGAPHILKDKL